MRDLVLIASALCASTSLALAQDDAPWGASAGQRPIELARLDGFPGALPIGPVEADGGRSALRTLAVHADGAIELDPLDEALGEPDMLLGVERWIIAPLWFHFDGKCPGRPERNDTRYAVEDGGLIIRWTNMTVGGTACDANAALYDFEVRLEVVDVAGQTVVGRPADGADALRMTFAYGALPQHGFPRAGIALPSQNLELFPDEAKGIPRTDRALRLMTEGSEGERGAEDGSGRAVVPGIWVIELGFDGRLRHDPDRDGVRSADNCPWSANPEQANFVVPDRDPHDGVAPAQDNVGDACDTDHDNDGRRNGLDNCAWVPNREQDDQDGDARGDVCDPDRDGDGVPDWSDNCLLEPNPAQLDFDLDGRGDRCDADPDGDGHPTFDARGRPHDACPWVADSVQLDSDGDGLGDACDTRPAQWADEDERVLQLDSDGDDVPDTDDICPWAPDPRQLDEDADGLGDACDPDADGDGVLDIYQGRCFSSKVGLLGDCPAVAGDEAWHGVEVRMDVSHIRNGHWPW